jgi:hypothetical protein
MTLREEALAARREERASEARKAEEERVRQRELTTTQLQRAWERTFGGPEPQIDPDACTATRDGITLLYQGRGALGPDHWRLVQACPDCGEPVYSPLFFSLADLGQMLEEGEGGATWAHLCPGDEDEDGEAAGVPFDAEPEPEPEPTLGERLEALIREIAREVEA